MRLGANTTDYVVIKSLTSPATHTRFLISRYPRREIHQTREKSLPNQHTTIEEKLLTPYERIDEGNPVANRHYIGNLHDGTTASVHLLLLNTGLPPVSVHLTLWNRSSYLDWMTQTMHYLRCTWLLIRIMQQTS